MAESRVEIENNSLIVYESLPKKIIATKGLKAGTLFLYSEEDWEDFQERLDKLLNKYLESSDLQSPEFRNIRVLRRYFVGPAVLIECKKRDDEANACLLPEDLIKHLNEEEGKYICKYVEKDDDNWGSRWIIERGN